MASKKKRELSQADEPQSKKEKIEDVTEWSGSMTTQRVVLNLADCNLDFNIEGNGLQGSGLHEQGFAYCWSGARGNVGITRGKYCFGCKIISTQPVDVEDTAPDQQHICRVGISRGDQNVGTLGETEHSFGFGGTGKFSSAGNFEDYGEKFGVGDTIVCAINLEDRPLASIGFSKNGKRLGLAKQFDAGPKGLRVVDSPIRRLRWESALFPHVLLKNVAVQLQFSAEEGLVPEEDYKPWASALEDGNAIMGPSFSKPEDCEVIMMVGLPASGKTTWAEKWVKEHPEKRYILLGTNLILDQMKVPGLRRKHNYGERFDHLMDKATAIFNTLLSRAANTPHNYILDQTNVYKNARKRKLKPFAFFQKIAVVVFPRPEELKYRSDKRSREMGKEVPADAINKMLAEYVLPGSKDMPESDEYFDQVIFVELNRAESQRHLDEMKHALASAPNLNLEKSSHYSRESSVQSFTGVLPQNQGAVSVTGGNWQSFNPPLHPSYYTGPNQVNAAYPRDEIRGGTGLNAEVYQDTRYRAAGRVVGPPGTNWSNENSLSRVDTGYSGSYGGIPSGSASPYLGYGAGDPYSRPNTNNIPACPYRSMVEPSPFGTGNTTPYSYGTHGGHFIDIGGHRADLQAPGAPPCQPRPSPANYGSPVGIPSLRPPHANFPNDMWYFGGYAPPHQ
ncbi:Heterogeneous nuclear ribonucleoprotein U-like protein 1 [Morella rubra]|uniref:Heterogeneous nuclear ribonucleoprotein U-like protein 1 n=1 Tax=Morella rubra TaxID=262757 RepID=A0A6A1WC41_9ROSI|nr:Heterogeneous nuclear ribonucleoprotein U-like protein 1 [Morella rubra]